MSEKEFDDKINQNNIPPFEGFEWDNYNKNQCIDKYPERNNSIKELESVFSDANLVSIFDYTDSTTQEPTYLALGLSSKGRLLHIKFVIRHGKARIYHAYPTTKQKWRDFYEKGS